MRWASGSRSRCCCTEGQFQVCKSHEGLAARSHPTGDERAEGHADVQVTFPANSLKTYILFIPREGIKAVIIRQVNYQIH